MTDFYTAIDVEVGETVMVERLLALIDGAASSAIARVACGVLFPPSPEDRSNLGLWLSMLHFRGPATRRWMEMIADQVIKMQLSLVHDQESARTFLRSEVGVDPDTRTVSDLLDLVADMENWEAVPHQSTMVQHMLTLGLNASPCFFGRHWVVVKFREQGLILTDKPVALYQRPGNWSPHRGVGVATADELWLPLDRSTALLLHNEHDVGNQVIRVNDGFSVDDFNQNSVSQMHQELYCHPEDLPRVSQLRLPSPDRPMTRVSGADWLRAHADGVNATPRRASHRRYRRGQ